MTAELDKERERLSQAKFFTWVSQDFPPTSMLPVWLSKKGPTCRISVFCALIPNAKIDDVLGHPTWDLLIGRGMPGFTQHASPGADDVIEYDRFGGYNGLEPLAFYREFGDLRPTYIEVSEEFRLYHCLFHDRATNKYIKIDDAGNETEVISVDQDQISIRLHELKQFLAARDMHLAVYFDNSERSRHALATLALSQGGDDIRDGLMSYCLSYGEGDGITEWKTHSRLLGKRLFPPYSKKKCGIWPFSDEESPPLVEFIIRVDENGDEVLGATDSHGGGVEFLTPVFFRRTVLDKYYRQHTKYSVEDSYLRCGHLWGLTMDNHHDDYVVAWLGDLGRDLPHEEQLLWRSHNIPPCGSVSEVFFKRQIEAEFADSDQPDIEFQHRYPEFCAACKKRLGWSLLLPLSEKDLHCFTSLRIPATDDQNEFDDLVLGLTKVLVDSLNEAELMKVIPADARSRAKRGIDRLQAVLGHRNATGFQQHIQFLRDLQSLRSSGSAHRKGTNYEKIVVRFARDTQKLSAVFRGMLVAALQLLDYLEEAVGAGTFDVELDVQRAESEPDI